MTRLSPSPFVALTGLALTLTLVGCAGAPRQSPLPTSRIETGDGTLADVRRQFSGRWDLISYEVLDADGTATPVPATGTVVADEFGNVEFTGEVELEDGDGRAEAPLNASGRLAIDVPLSRFLVLRLEEDETTTETFAAAPPDSFRYYEFVEDEVHIVVRTEDDVPTARYVYRRRP